MQFRPQRPVSPEINLIPFIDVLLVVIIFLVLSTTYARFTELQIKLPNASVNQPVAKPVEIPVFIDASGNYSINQTLYRFDNPTGLQGALQKAMQGSKDSVVVIYADAATPHQAVVLVMDEARKSAISRITFAAQDAN